MLNKINKRNILVLGCSVAAIGYIFSIATASLGMILFIVSWLINFKEIDFKKITRLGSIHWVVYLFIYLILGLLYTSDLYQGQKIIIRHLSFLIFPLIFLTIKPFTKEEKAFVIKFFIYSLTFFFIVCFAHAIFRQILLYQRGGGFNWYFFFRYDLLEVLRQHPVYVAMYANLAISFLLFYKNKLVSKKWLVTILLFIQIIGVLFSGSRIGYIILFIIIALNIKKNVKLQSGTFNKGKIAIYVLSAITLLLVMWNIPIIKERVLFTLGYDYEYKFNKKQFVKDGMPEKKGRLLLWQDSFELIKERPFLGYGTGDAQTELNKIYKKNEHEWFLKERYNSHNTYLTLLIMGGFIFLILYLLLLREIYIYGMEHNDLGALSFFIIIILVSITETIFRAQGILFFTFFYCFFLSKKTNE
ncbi:O-antigen ligase family protein [uncultured Aquimarina sp.]|uniref:O-antigen ligase family protein n=1 Tax=uncultured Aquimarina sp. TaxID=575652 RepID=UPI00260E3909|nr:O-antigen ligase family protein [uncultured Aquimarina sp.]